MMPSDKATPCPSRGDSDAGYDTFLSGGVVAAVVAGLSASWIAAGSAGLLAHGLRHALTWVALGIAIVSGWPATGLFGRQFAVLLGMLASGIALTASPQSEVNVLAAPLVLAGLASFHGGAPRRVLTCAALAAFIFALCRLLLASSPLVWLLADRLGQVAGAIGGWIAGRPLRVGATFAGLDFLVLSGALLGLLSVGNGRLALRRVAAGGAGILVAHVVYLVLLAYAADLRALLPAVKPDTEAPLWLSSARAALPWNVPAIGLLLHAGVLTAMARWMPVCEDEPAVRAKQSLGPGVTLAIAVLATVVLALCTTLCVGRYTLQGRKVVLYEKGFLNWLKPKHGDYGRLSIGMYGLLPHFVRSLGAQCVVSPDLAEKDIQDADVLVLIYPDKPWEAGQLQRIHGFVERGGSLLLLGEHTVRDADGSTRFNEVLAPTRMNVLFDCAEFAVGGWLHSFDTLAHPALLGIGDERNELGIVVGASLEASWPARPLVIGRWGWSDWGDEGGNAFIGNVAYDAGEKLGDVILVAEQSLGKGRVIAFGDTSTFSNGINMGAHAFTSRLFAYLAGPRDNPSAPWRTPVMALAAALLAWALALHRRPLDLALVCLLIALLRTAVTYACERATELHPRVPRDSGYRLAYLDSSHAGLYSSESWRDDGLMGLALNLMRNGYLTLDLHKFSAEALLKSDLFISVAPAREYTAAERSAIRRFLEQGGIFILTVGYDERRPSQSLLSEFGFEIGDGTRAEGTSTGPRPLGFFKSPYYNAGSYMNHVRFHAAWPVFCPQSGARVLAYGRGDLPVIMMRPIGNGKMVVVGDTCFAMNKNLEVESGEPFEGMRENPHFWRWLLTYLRGDPMWIPPNPRAPQQEDAGTGGQP
jgi:hypothetical protein